MEIPLSLLQDRALVEDVFASIDAMVLPSASALFGVPLTTLSLKDVFVIKYDAADARHAGLEPHVDGAAYSFNTVLCAQGEAFEGGSTAFECLGWGRPLQPGVGDALLHAGELMHSGVAVTRGVRFVLVGFVRLNPHAQAAG